MTAENDPPAPRQRNRLAFDEALLAADAIRKELHTLINSPSCNELSIKPFFERYTSFIPTAWRLNHGIHFNMMFPQFAISPSLKSDMLYLTKSTVNWWCVLIEFENPRARLFQDKGRIPRRHSDFIAGLDQIESWKRHLAKHRTEFLSRLTPVMVPLGHNPVEFKFILVIGRRSEFLNDRAKLEAFASYETGDPLRVMTYDSLLSATEYAGYPEDFHLMAPMGINLNSRNYWPDRVWYGRGSDLINSCLQIHK
jgi:hypothetical protein